MRRPLTLLSLLLLGTAQAADLEDVLSALKKGRTQAARGQAEVTVLFPPRATPTRTAQQLPELTVRPTLIAKNFNVTRAGSEQVAGRDATRFTLTPKVGDAARWTLWVDVKWNVPLAFEERRADGTLARRAALTRTQPNLTRVTRAAPPAVPSGLRAALTRALPGLQFPAGFIPVGVQARGKGTEVALTDGVNVLALVISPQDVRAAPGVASRRVGPLFVWLVGNLPQTTLLAALAGIRSATPDPLGTFSAPADSNP